MSTNYYLHHPHYRETLHLGKFTGGWLTHADDDLPWYDKESLTRFLWTVEAGWNQGDSYLKAWVVDEYGRLFTCGVMAQKISEYADRGVSSGVFS